jgi:hypothetical protein
MAYVEPLRDDGQPRAVRVRVDDACWVAGLLELLWENESVCWAIVRYSTESGDTQMGWFEQSRIQRAESDHGRPA